MKTALSLVISYLAFCVFGIALCAFLYMVCEGLVTFVVGQHMSFFSLDFFKKGLVFSIPAVCVVAQLRLILRVLKINRAKKARIAEIDRNLVVGLLLHMLFCSLSWFVLFPAVADFAASQMNSGIVAINPVSTGYFRENDSGIIYYYTEVHSDGSADGLLFDTNKKEPTSVDVVQFKNLTTAGVSAYPYSDVLVRNAIHAPKGVSDSFDVYSTILRMGKKSWEKGLPSWLSFASLGLVIVSIYGFQFASSWRLINSIFTFLVAAFAAFMNYLYYVGKLPSFVMDLDYSLPMFDKAALLLMNFSMFVFFSAFGIVMCVYRRRKAKAAVQDYYEDEDADEDEEKVEVDESSGFEGE